MQTSLAQTAAVRCCCQQQVCFCWLCVLVVGCLMAVLKLASDRLGYAFEPFDWQ